MATPPDTRAALAEGLADAIGFVVGALAGWQLGRWLGFDAIGSREWDAGSLVGLLFVLAGCGAGKWASNRWRARRRS